MLGLQVGLGLEIVVIVSTPALDDYLMGLYG
jgi:hypothetical protein